MKRFLSSIGLIFLFINFYTTVNTQPLEFYDIKDSLHVKDCQTHYTSDAGWINIALTGDSSILIIKFDHCGDTKYIKRFKVDTLDLFDLHTTITRSNGQDSVYLTSVMDGPKNRGIFCLVIFASNGDIKLPKLTNIPNFSLYSNPVLLANGMDRLLAFNAGNSELDLTGHMLRMDELFQFKADVRLKDHTLIRDVEVFDTLHYLVTMGDRLVGKLFNTLQFDYIYQLDSSFTHFNRNLEVSSKNNAVLLGSYHVDSSSSYFTIVGFSPLNNTFNYSKSLVSYHPGLNPKLIYYNNLKDLIDENYGVTHLSTVDSTGGSIHSVTLFNKTLYNSTNSYLTVKPYSTLAYGLTYLPFENNFLLTGSYLDTFRYFNAKLNKRGGFSQCGTIPNIDTIQINTSKKDTFSLLNIESFPPPSVNSTITNINYDFDFKRSCTFFDYLQGPAMIDYCKDTMLIISAVANDPESYRNQFVRYQWSTGETTLTRPVSTPSNSISVTTFYCNEIATLTYNFTKKTCPALSDSAVHIPNVFAPGSEVPDDKLFGIVIDSTGRFTIKSFNLKIFSRWGKEVFSSTSFVDEWDGNFNGEPAPADTYVVILEIIDTNDIGHSFKKMFTLLR